MTPRFRIDADSVREANSLMRKADILAELRQSIERVEGLADDEILSGAVILVHRDPAGVQEGEPYGVEIVGTLAPAYLDDVLHTLRYGIARIRQTAGLGNRADRRRTKRGQA